MIFERRRIDVTFTGKTTVKLSGYRTTARIVKMGGVGMGTAEIAIFGMELSLMNQLATFGTRVHPTYDYQVLVEAGDDTNGMSKVFEGTVTQAWADFQSMPQIPFHVVAQAGLVNAVQTGQPSSYEGSADVAQIMKNLAGQMGLAFENNGVSEKLDNPYFFGSPRGQARAVAEAAGISWLIDDGKLAIWPPNKPRAGGHLEISKDTGMISEPTFTDYGVLVRIEFTRALTYGTQFSLKSIITPANGTWMINLLDYDLAAKQPGGHWFVSLGGYRDASGVIPLP